MKKQDQMLVSSSRISHLTRRDKIEIINDILLKLVEYGELNQTALMSFCGLNLTKHRGIIEDLETHGFIQRETQTLGRAKTISLFKLLPEGLTFLKEILEPYEKMFPRE
jgi:predicted transcriptional regulator